MIEIVEVKTKKQLRQFVMFPYKLFGNEKNWVPPLRFDEFNTLDKKKNPAFEFCEAKYFLAYKDGEIAGRVAGIINHRYIEKWNNKYARFGWMDFIDDLEVARALTGAVENYAKENGLEYVHGPLGFCDLDKEGMLVDGYEYMSMFITIYNYPYYIKHLETLGYGKDTDWIEFQVFVPKEIPARLEKLNKMVMRRLKLNIVEFKNKKEILPYAKGIFDLLNVAYKDLYGVVELSKAQIDSYIKQYFGFVNPDYVRVILNEENELVAFGIAIPSLAEASKKANGKVFPFGFIHLLRSLKKAKVLELLLVAVAPSYQGKGLNAIILNEINKKALENGIEYAETGPELETNKNVQSLWKFYEVNQHKRRRCFIKKI